MARGGLKKSVKASKTRLLQYLVLTVLLKIVSLGFHFFRTESGLEGRFLPTFLWLFSEMLLIGILYQRSKAVYDEEGILVDCVDITDSNSLGMYNYVFDSLVVLWTVETGTLYSRKFYILFGIAPMATILRIVAACTPSAPTKTISAEATLCVRQWKGHWSFWAQ
ncbi:hypothetical protein XU18_1228 [Perkinsela sp. CCAP 1560/4]|nr:hypothetical protein XU18_1228 [Perkinsela sp. CCAP 1560/4]|eukprot:KNH08220.1 hypothetical protein XU18_1228 [Perkinsela sp. CCAP 1560/4]